MSIKIYSAYKFKGNGQRFIEFCKYMRNLNVDNGVQKLLSYAPRIEINDPNYKLTFWDKFFLTRRVFPKVKLESLYLTDIYDYLEELSVKYSHDPHPLNLSGSIVAYFHKDSIYVQFFMSKSLFEKISDEFKDLLEDFHYQNQSDMSNYDSYDEPWEEMTKERQTELEDDWEFRRQVWEEILDEKGVPSDNGLIYELFTESICYDILDEFFYKKIGNGKV